MDGNLSVQFRPPLSGISVLQSALGDAYSAYNKAKRSLKGDPHSCGGRWDTWDNRVTTRVSPSHSELSDVGRVGQKFACPT